MAQKPLRHVIVKHHLPGLRSAVLGIVLALVAIAAAIGCPAKGNELSICGSGVLLVVVIMLLVLPRRIRHLWHRIEHADLLYFVLIAAVAVAVLFYLPTAGYLRVVIAVVIFLGLLLLKLAVDKKFK